MLGGDGGARRAMVRAAFALAALVALAALSSARAQRATGLHVHVRWIGQPAQGAPLIVALHPWGSSGASMIRLLERARFDRPVRVVAPDGPLPYGRGHAWISSAVADADPHEQAREASEAAQRVAALIRAERQPGQPVIVAGISQGAVVAYALAARAPDAASVFIPAAGLLPARITPAPGGGRIVALHGERDPFVPFARTREGVERLREAGRDVELQSLPHHGHRVRGPLRALLFATLRAELARLSAQR